MKFKTLVEIIVEVDDERSASRKIDRILAPEDDVSSYDIIDGPEEVIEEEEEEEENPNAGEIAAEGDLPSETEERL